MHGCLSLIHARIHANKLPITAQPIRNLRTQKWTEGGSYSRHPLRSLLNPSPSRFFLPPYPLLTPATRATPYKHFGSLCWVSSVKARQSEHARTLLARAQGSTFSALPQLGGVNLFPGKTFLHSNGPQDSCIVICTHRLRTAADWKAGAFV